MDETEWDEHCVALRTPDFATGTTHLRTEFEGVTLREAVERINAHPNTNWMVITDSGRRIFGPELAELFTALS